MIKKLLFIIMCFLATCGMSYADDFGVWTSVAVDKKIDKRLTVGAEAEMRTSSDLGGVERWTGEVSASYKIFYWLKVATSYKLIDTHYPEKNTYHTNGRLNKHTPDYWNVRHRFNLSLTGSFNIDRLNVSLRERWQYTYRPEKTVQRYDDDDEEWEDKVVKSKGKNGLRSRLQLEYKIKNFPINPYGSIELFNAWSVQKVRYTLGGDLKITKKHHIDFFYRYQHIDKAIDDDDNSSHIIGLGYSYKF